MPTSANAWPCISNNTSGSRARASAIQNTSSRISALPSDMRAARAGALKLKAAAVTDFREAARRRLPRFLFDYIDGGSYDEITLKRNVADLAAIELRQRTLIDVSAIRLDIELFNRRWNLPVGLAPVGLSGMYAR